MNNYFEYVKRTISCGWNILRFCFSKHFYQYGLKFFLNSIKSCTPKQQKINDAIIDKLNKIPCTSFLYGDLEGIENNDERAVL